MKYIKLLICQILIIPCVTLSLDDYTSQTFMFARPVFDSISTQQAGWSNLVYQKQQNGTAFQTFVLYEQNFEQHNAPEYFLFDFKDSLTISSGSTATFTAQTAQVAAAQEGQMYTQSFNRDILGQWLGLNNLTKNVEFTVNPKQRQGCVWFEASQDLKRFFSWSLFENWFVNVSAPLTWIESNINITGDQKAVDAFNQPSFGFVCMKNEDLTSWRLDQISIALGTKYWSENDIHVITTTGFIIPLVEQNTNRDLFAPVHGFNAHFGMSSQQFFQFPIYQKSEESSSKMLFFLNISNNFLARNHQLRTYDIKHKPYSRYMKLLDRTTNSLIPAMNALTVRSRVEPYFITNFSTGIRFKFGQAIGEVGYELWAHGSERVTPEPKDDQHDGCGMWYDNRYAIPFINTDGVLAKIDGSGNVVPLEPNEPGLSASASTINYVASPDGYTSCCSTQTFNQQNKYLKLKDLDRFSCASRSTVLHKAFANLSLCLNGQTRDCFVNFGLFIQAAQNNASLGFWGGHIKAGISF